MAKKKALKFLLCRFGGIGDSIMLTPVVRELRRKHKGCKVHFAVRAEIAELFQHDKLFDRILPVKRMMPSNLDCIHRDGGWVAIECIKQNYDMVYDFKLSVELNSPYQQLAPRDGPWRMSMNSNFTNWLELSFGWTNIDWTEVLERDGPEAFLPQYVVTDEEREWARARVPDKDGPVIGIQLRASSFARTWYRAEELPEKLRVLIPNARILYFDHNALTWVLTEPIGTKRIEVKGEGGLRKSAALVERMDLLVTADSGYSHVAAALGTPTLTLYTTVPGWTREKYYPNSHAIQSDLSCSPCFTLEGWCPKQQQRALEGLSEQEKRLLAYGNQNTPLAVAAAQEKMPPQAVMAAHAAIQQKLQALRTLEPDCMRAITPELIAERSKEILDA